MTVTVGWCPRGSVGRVRQDAGSGCTSRAGSWRAGDPTRRALRDSLRTVGVDGAAASMMAPAQANAGKQTAVIERPMLGAAQAAWPCP